MRIYWPQILYITGSYNVEWNILDIIPDSHYYREVGFTNLPLELGGRRKKRRGLERKLE